MDKRVYIQVIVPNSYSIIQKWFREMKFFLPKDMQISGDSVSINQKYNQDFFFDKLLYVSLNDTYLADFSDDINEVGVTKSTQSKNTVILTAYFDFEIFKENQSKIYCIIDELIITKGINGSICMLDDNFWQNTDNISIYKSKEKTLDGIPLTKHRIYKGRVVVDIKKMPGYNEYVNGVWFGSAWKMWFGSDFLKFVDKEVLENFNDCFENRIISDGCNTITLYEDILDFDDPVNRERQWLFKRAIDFDNLIEKAKQDPIIIDNAVVEFVSGNFDHGGTKQMREYSDIDGNSVGKKEAVKVFIIEYDNSGKILWNGEELLK